MSLLTKSLMQKIIAVALLVFAKSAMASPCVDGDFEGGPWEPADLPVVIQSPDDGGTQYDSILALVFTDEAVNWNGNLYVNGNFIGGGASPVPAENELQMPLTGFEFGAEICIEVQAQNIDGNYADWQSVTYTNGPLCNVPDFVSATNALGEIVPELDVTRCSPDDFITVDISRRAENAALPGFERNGNMGNDQSILTGPYRYYYGLNFSPAVDEEILDQPTIVDAHANTALVYDYLNGTLGINSFDNLGSSMRSEVDMIGKWFKDVSSFEEYEQALMDLLDYYDDLIAERNQLQQLIADGVSYPPSDNMILNGGFNTDLTDWTQDLGSNAYVRLGSPDPYEGAGYYAGNERDEWFGSGDDTQSYQEVDISGYVEAIDRGLQIFQVSAQLSGARVNYLAGPINHRARLAVQFYDEFGGELSSWRSALVATDKEWVLVEETLRAPIGARVARVNLIGDVPAGYGGQIRGYFDDVWFVGNTLESRLEEVLNEISEIQAWALFAFLGIEPCSLYLDNAFYSDGRGVSYCKAIRFANSFASSLDVVAHEWAHGITARVTGGLDYEYESGALNEAFSDWVGLAVKQANGNSAFTLAEKTVPGGIRDMLNPHEQEDPSAYGPNFRYFYDGDPDTGTCDYRPDDWEPPRNAYDNCGVHVNSGVMNKFFTLLTVGGEFRGYTNTGISDLDGNPDYAAALDLALQVNTFLPSDASFAEARMVWEAFAIGTGFEAQVSTAWNSIAVNVPQHFVATESSEESICGLPPFGNPGDIRFVLEPLNPGTGDGENHPIAWEGASAPFAENDLLELIAEPAPGFDFVRFEDSSGNLLGTAGVPFITLPRINAGNNPGLVRAVFRKVNTVTVNAFDQQGNDVISNVAISGAGQYESCEPITLSIDSFPLVYSFEQWGGVGVAETPVDPLATSITFTLADGVDMSAVAYFRDNSSLLLNGGFNDDLSHWTQDLGSAAYVKTTSPVPFEGTGYLMGNTRDDWFGSGIDTRLYQDVDLASYTATIDAGTQRFTLSGQLAGRTSNFAAGPRTDGASMQVQFFDGGGAVISTWSSAVIRTNKIWTYVEEELTVPVGTRSLRLNLIGDVPAGFGGAVDAYFDDIRLAPEL